MRCVAIVAALLGAACAIPVDNGIVGDPEIFCGPTAIDITFNTQNAFSGHVYVKNRFAEVRLCSCAMIAIHVQTDCRTTGDNSQAIGRITLDFSTCGVNRRRSTEPLGMHLCACGMVDMRLQACSLTRLLSSRSIHVSLLKSTERIRYSASTWRLIRLCRQILKSGL